MNEGITWPLQLNVIRGKKTGNTFGMVRTYANGTPKPHQGWDFEASVGAPAYAIADGEVVFVKNEGAYGVQMCMSFNLDGVVYYAFYAHLQYVNVSAGQQLKMNDVIGRCGNTGNASNLPASENHLHFEVRTTPNCGLGLAGRISPLNVFGFCPLNAPVVG